jgi:uncharacterized protein (DUF305 family)
MNLRALAVSATVATLVAVPGLASAQGTHGGHSGHAMPAGASTAETPATKGYREANAKMHREMDIPFTNDADADFVRAMIPHHQGAIDMAKVALQHAKNDQIRKLAGDVIREQEREIAEMQAWLKANGKP